AEYKSFDSDYPTAAFGDLDCFCLFDGDSYTITGLYLFPQKVGIGRFQPYVSYTSVEPDASSDRDEIQGGVNYIIDGHNARISAFYQHGDIMTKGLNYAPGAAGDDVGSFRVAFQLQL